MKLRINEMAKLTGVTVRTLHYYDEIGLLVPSEVANSGYRLYDEDSLATLQQILFFRELDFPLDEIGRIMHSKGYSSGDAMRNHRELLLAKRQRLDKLLALLDKTMRGQDTMSFNEFDMGAINAHKEKYAAEVTERWGNSDAYVESEKKTASYTEQQWVAVTGEGAQLMRDFAALRSGLPDSPEAQALVKSWQQHITDSYYSCTDEILAGLGQMYIADERFTANIDKHGEGTAAFMSLAIECYCNK